MKVRVSGIGFYTDTLSDEKFKEFARLHSKFGLKKEDVLEAIKAYAQELGLEYGPVNYFMMCDPKYANDLGEIVQ